MGPPPVDVVRTADVEATTAATAVPQARRITGAGRVRPLARDDLEEVADVFLRVFRGMADAGRRARALPDVVAYLDQLYLGCPWYDPATGSLVHRDAAGNLDGFLGSISMHLRFGEERLTASAMGTFMVADPRHRAEAALALTRHHLANGLDIYFTDTANRITLEIGRSMRAELLPLNSLEWVLALRPASLALDRAARLAPWLPRRLLRPLARRFDRPLHDLMRGADRLRREVAVVIADMTEDDFLAAAPVAVADRRLRPEWSAEELGWLLARARQRTGNGPLRLRQARDRHGHRLGFWVDWAEPGGIAAVLQIFADPHHVRATLDAVIADAETLGCIAVRGATEPRLMEALYGVPGLVFHHKGATGLRAADPAVLQAARSGDAAIGGLTGESWTRLVSDRF